MNRVAFVLLLLLALESATAQTGGDQWFILDDFSGLNLYLDETKVPVGGALAAENIQFSRVGTMSALGGLTKRTTIFEGFYNNGSKGVPIRGIEALADYVNDSDRVYFACGGLLWNTNGNSWTTFSRSTAASVGYYKMWADSTRVEYDSSTYGRAAEFWRPGWLIETVSSPPSVHVIDTIDYISDNGTLFLTTAAGSAAVAGDSIALLAVYPRIDSTINTRFVKVEIDGRQAVVALQAGKEPILMSSAPVRNARYFGIADSGYVQTVGGGTVDTGSVYIVDNSKINIYDRNELVINGYWLHLPYNFTDTDSSHWGHVWRIDSNKVVNAGDTSQFRIYFTPGKDSADKPGGAWKDSLTASRYNLISGPFRRTVYSQDATPSAIFENGGETIRMATGTISPREFDHIPHAVIVKNDTILNTYADSIVYCYQGKCDTLRVGWNDGASIEFPPGVTESKLHRDVKFEDALPIRTSFTDTGHTVITTANNGAGATWIKASALTQANDYWNGATITFLNGSCDDSTVTVTDFVASSDSLVFASVGCGATIGDSFQVSFSDSIIIWTSGHNGGEALSDFTSSDWEVDRVTIPYASDGVVYNNRLFLAGDPQEPNFIVYSEPFQVGAFPQRNAISVGGNGDKFTAFFEIYDWLGIAQERHIWLLKGDPNLGGTLELALPDEGVLDPKTISVEGNRVRYLSHKGWREFDGNNAHDWGIQIKPAVQAQPRASYSVSQAYKSKSASAFDPTTGNTWCSMPFGSSATNSGSFVHNIVGDNFTYSNEVYGGLIKSIVFNDTTWLIFTHPDSAHFYSYGRTDSLTPTGIDGDSMRCRWASGWMDFGAPYQYKTVDYFMLTGTYGTGLTGGSGGNHKIILRFYRDGSDSILFADTSGNIKTISNGNVYKLATYTFQFDTWPESTVAGSGREFKHLKVEILGYGFTVFQPERLAIRYNVDLNRLPKDSTTIFRSP